MGNDALVNHVIDNGWVFLFRSNIDAEAQTHDASRADRTEGQSKLLVGDLVALNGDCVVEVVAFNVSLVEVGDAEILVDEFVRLAIFGIDWQKC